MHLATNLARVTKYLVIWSNEVNAESSARVNSFKASSWIDTPKLLPSSMRGMFSYVIERYKKLCLILNFGRVTYLNPQLDNVDLFNEEENFSLQSFNNIGYKLYNERTIRIFSIMTDKFHCKNRVYQKDPTKKIRSNTHLVNGNIVLGLLDTVNFHRSSLIELSLLAWGLQRRLNCESSADLFQIVLEQRTSL